MAQPDSACAASPCCVGGVEVERVLVGEVRLDVEGDLLHGARERERLLVLVVAVDDAAVVASDVHPRVAGEPDRHGVVHPPFADGPVVDVQRHFAAGRRRRAVGRELHAHGHVAGREILLGDLFEGEHAHHRVGVGELAVLDVEREPAEVVGFGDDHAFGAAFGHDEVCSDRVRAVVDPRDHAGHHVLDIAAELERRLLRDRRQDAEERRERRRAAGAPCTARPLPRTGP